MVFYRTYRPQSIEELDSESVRQKLYSILLSNSVPHAFLFTGPKGLGKTSTARIVAKVLNCLKVKKTKDRIEPCNTCQQCTSITNGSNLDVLEIDGASNRGIDEIRDLREKIRLAPLSAQKKIYIIDEVHMLTTEAFNALLKTLEEPPSHALFIFCTTEQHKVPSTILSRCFHITFQLATENELVRSFERIIKKENIAIDEKALIAIAHMAQGSFRDGTKILEEIVALSKGKKITKELVEEQYQITNIDTFVVDFLHNLERKDAKSLLSIIGEMTTQGIDMRYFIEEILNRLHQHLLVTMGVLENNEKTSDFRFTIEEIKLLIELLTKAHLASKFAILPQLPIELAVIGWCTEKSDNLPLEKKEVHSDYSSNQVTPKVVERDKPEEKAAADSYQKLWYSIIDQVKLHNHSLAGVLRGCYLKSYDEKSIIIETAYQFHKDRLSDSKIVDLLQTICNTVTGKNILVSIVLKKKESA